MSNELVNIAPAGSLVQGGLGVNLQSKFFKLKPGTLNIVQPNSQQGTRGNLRISETGQEYKTMRVALLLEPVEQREFHIGDGNMNRKPENLMCFSRDMIRPDAKAKVPQAVNCSSCPNASWDKYRQTKAKEDIPKCDAYYYAVLIDTEFQLPLRLFVRSKSKKPFDKGMESVARTILTAQSQGKNPNLFDVSFTLGTEAIKNDNGTTSYILKLSDFQSVTDEERVKFGNVYQDLVNRRQVNDQAYLEHEAERQIDNTQSAVDNLVSEGEYVDQDQSPITI